ncbi:MAG: FGGY family carbohydrate kinase, partial [Promethearchaeota archaeon]
MTRNKYILAVDSGGSRIRAMLFDEKGSIKARDSEKIVPSTPEPGALEYDPEGLWQTFITVVKRLFTNAKCKPEEVAALGVCNQRASFVLWDRNSGKPMTKLISWADVRAARTCDEMNNSSKWRQLKTLAKIFSRLTGNLMLTTSSMLNFTTDHASVRLKWILDRNAELKNKMKNGEISFGTLDSWFIYKLTGHKVHATDFSNAAATGLFNPFSLKWNKVFVDLFDLDMSIFPNVIDTNGDFGNTDPTIFNGATIPIRAAVGDQMGALFGQGCFEPGMVKISQGSGAFVDMNV